ncbi:MAG: ATP-dependent helicase [Candidatus Cloacimonetes bacterium HGW-Cloacimonetes-1]|jgi:SNF2 family DNA or RNA helicase|nr:MAG: ATP-dependent helicase [Candidatus Cloacimonetes bacterium HGW-Cloacimonetes-1]
MKDKYTLESSLRDNHKRGCVGDFISEHAAKDSKLAFVSAYFTIYAFQQLKNRLNDIEHLRFLFGEPRFISSIDPTKTDKKQFQIEDDQLIIPLENRLVQRLAARECHQWITAKTEIKSMIKPNFLHGKMYHITPPKGSEKAILGSSNFTVNGLGFGKSPNIELNIEITDDKDRKDLLKWFDELWNDDTGLVEDVKPQVLKYLEQLYANNSPEFIYYKTLYHLFEQYLEEQDAANILTGKAGLFDSQIWNTLYDFQKDAVKAIINKLERHNGCILADSVGLGKTYEALAVIKHYESRNKDVLVLCPKKLKDNWTVYQANKRSKLNLFSKDRFAYSVAYHTDLGRISGFSDADAIDMATFNWGEFDLVVIDESHNLRGNPKEKEREGEKVYNRAKFLMEKVFKEGSKTKVLMLSATPVNTTLKDLRNQIYYITEEDDAAMKAITGIESISSTLVTAQKQFTDWVKQHKQGERKTSDLLSRLDSSFFKLLDELTIARSRKHILRFYNAERVGFFPERLKPISIYPDIDLMGQFYSYDKISDEIQKYRLSLFNPNAFLKDEYKAQYGDLQILLPFTQKEREIRLIGMMKVGFMKRLESSINAFALTMNRTLDKIESLLNKIERYDATVNISDTFELEDDYAQEFDEDSGDFSEEWTVGKKLKYQLQHLDLPSWKKALRNDKDQILSLYYAAKAVSPERDAKLQNLKDLIRHKQQHTLNADNKKVLVFTAFSDTAEYLYNNIIAWAAKDLGVHCALISGSTLNKTTLRLPAHFQNDFNAILTCFAPKAKRRDQLSFLPQTEEIDILIATDCISEGQNLQDCDYVINYDIHWNPVRIIQRFGRIDRINSPNKQIQLVNYWPTKELDKYIKLKLRVETRMALVDVTATGEDNLFNDTKLDDQFNEELKFRSRQLKKLQSEVIDLEDMEEGISLTDFSLDDFRIDLVNYLKTNEQLLREAPLGLYAITPSPHHDLWNTSSPLLLSPDQHDIMRPGIIFCFRQLTPGREYEQLNPLHPYFLAYIRDDGTVRYGMTHVKQILEIYRLLALDRSAAFDALCDMFDTQTAGGYDMDIYNDLLKKAMADIKHSMGKKAAQQLQTSRSGVLPIKSKDSVNEYELITWLVIV